MNSLKAYSVDILGRNLRLGNERISYQFFGVFLKFLLGIEDFHIFPPSIGLQFDISSFVGFEFRIEEVNLFSCNQPLELFLPFLLSGGRFFSRQTLGCF